MIKYIIDIVFIIYISIKYELICLKYLNSFKYDMNNK